MRQYSVDDKGVEHIVHLYIENYWASDRESAIMLTPSKYNIDAWEETELLIVTTADMLDLMGKIPSFGQMTRLMDHRSFIASQRRLNSTISNTAEKRYEEFADNHLNSFNDFPNISLLPTWVLQKIRLAGYENTHQKNKPSFYYLIFSTFCIHRYLSTFFFVIYHCFKACFRCNFTWLTQL